MTSKRRKLRKKEDAEKETRAKLQADRRDER
jgi:hypothetical protein